ncbi:MULTISPECIES: cell division protein SepF [Cohnella]|uniref:cell division protein SepF n=1 Tax=Cohnella TaxID=329857 RepID=UPI0009BB7904|nr:MULTISPECIES: cell division protein SepF [Cohnella]MBN2983392.1 cell division protein SepF [Cohnella algarum]
MSVVNKFLNYFGLQDEAVDKDKDAIAEDEEQEIETPAFEPRKQMGKNNVVSIHSQKNVRVVLTEPRTYDEAQEIADQLKSRRTVVVNLQRVRRDHAVRIVDFLSGTVYALGGQISKLGPNIFLCTPDSVEISGTISELYAEEADYSKMR